MIWKVLIWTGFIIWVIIAPSLIIIILNDPEGIGLRGMIVLLGMFIYLGFMLFLAWKQDIKDEKIKKAKDDVRIDNFVKSIRRK